jgi:hypothetical protein|tara:strand:- start:6842 stop:7042 length:201 start_codon:yes stop_codon:yes gene_type:complete
VIEVAVYSSGYPCQCSGACNFTKAYQDAGKPRFIDYERYVKGDFIPSSEKEKKILKFINTTYCSSK